MRKNLQFKIYNLKLISNFKFQISNFCQRQDGFTIVEVLVVATILGVIGFMMSDIVSRSLAGNQKTITISTAKQNGQIALDSLSQAIRNSDQVICIDVGGVSSIPNPIGATPATGVTGGNTIALYSQDGTYNRFRFLNTAGTFYITEDQPQVGVLLNNVTHSQTEVCDISLTPLHNTTTLTDTDINTGVLIQNTGGATPLPIFTVVKRPGSKDSVTIQFDVRPRSAVTSYESQLGGTGAIQFQQTIQLR